MTTKIFMGVASSKVFTNVVAVDGDSFWEFTGTQPAGMTNSYTVSTSNPNSGFVTNANLPNAFSIEVVLRTTGTWIEDYSNQTIKIQFDGAASSSQTVHGYIAVDQEGGPGFGGNLYAEGVPGSAQGQKQWEVTLPNMSGSALWLKFICNSNNTDWASIRNIAVVLG